MAKKTLNESVLEKIFYYIGKGMRPVIFKKMSAKSRLPECWWLSTINNDYGLKKE